MGKGPGKQSSNEIINQDGKEMALGKENGRAACPKDMPKLFRALVIYVGCSCTKVLERNLGTSALSFISDLQCTFFE